VISSVVLKALTRNKYFADFFPSTVVGTTVLLTTILFAPAVLADPVTASGSERDGIGRMIFTWPSPVPFLARVQNKQIIIKFARPAEGSFSGLVRSLKKYIKAPRILDGGRTLVFPLLGNFDLNYSSRGRNVVVEVIDPNPPKTNASPLKAPKITSEARDAPKRGRKLERVSIRLGSHPSYSRVVFDWKRRVKYKVVKQGNLVTLTFQRPANIIVTNLNRNRLVNVKGARSQISGDMTIVGLSVNSSTELKHFRSGPKIILDVLNSTGPDDAPPIAKLVPRIKAVKKGQTQVAEKKNKKAPTNSKSVSTNSRMAKKSGKSKVPKKDRLTRQAVADVACPKSSSSIGKGTPSKNQRAFLRLDWPAPVAAAVFRRAGNLWMIFNKPTKVDICKLKEQGGPILKSIVQETADQATILRIVTTNGFNPSIRRNGFAWIFDFKKQPLKPQTVINVKSQLSSPRGPLLIAAIPDVGEAIPFKDTKVYDNLFVVPVIPLAHGIIQNYKYSHLNLLSTGQGIVVQPRVDDLHVRSAKRGVEISSATSLALSVIRRKSSSTTKFGRMNALTRIVKPKLWRKIRRQKSEDFYKLHREKLEGLTKTKGKDRAKARLDMALFLFGNGYGHEANGVLKLIRPKTSNVEAMRQHRFLLGATDFLMGRYKDALKALMHPSMYGNDEGEFWRAAAKLAAGEDVQNAAKIMNAKGAIFRAYPREIKMRLGMRTVEAAILAEDLKNGIKYLGLLAKEEPKPKEIDQLAFMEGTIKQMQGNFPGAIKAWKEVEKGQHRPSIAKAILARTDLELGTKKIKEKDVINELENLRFAWRGGDFEFSLLRKLGSLYLDVGDYRKGLRTLRNVVSNFRANPNSSAITQKMESAFEELFLNDVADKMLPIRSLALFEEFKELTPSGKKGDRMIQKLADRLASVDLLDKAAKLLEQQIKFRLTGIEKARVGTQLAAVYILDKKPEKALEALQKTNSTGQPVEMVKERRHLNARSLIDLKRGADALVPLEDDDSKEADLLRSEIHWGKNWSKAAKALQRLMVAAGAAPGRKLNDKQAQLVLNFGVALAYSTNNRGITRLSRDYLKEMDATPYKDAFRLIASPDNIGLIDYRTVANRVRTVSNFKNFMSVYRERLKAGNLSQSN